MSSSEDGFLDLLSESSADSEEDSASESEEESSTSESEEDSSSESEEEGASLILVPKAVVGQWACGAPETVELKRQQQEALDFLRDKSGLVAAGLGVGKTLIGQRWLGETAQLQVIKSRNQLSKLMVWQNGEWRLKVKAGVVLMTHSLYSSLVTGKRAESFWNNNKEQIQVKQLEKAAKQEGNRKKGRLAGFLLASWRAVVVDEAHVARNSKTALWRALEWLRRQVSRMLLLTGTPVVNRVQDLAALSALVNPKYDEAWWGRHGSNQDKVAKWRQSNMYYCEADVPAVTVEPLSFELSKEETVKYLESYNILKREVSDVESSMVHILAALQRVRQAMNCESKYAQVLKQLAQLPGKSLVYSQWTRSLRQLAEKLPAGSWLKYSGELTGKQRETVLQEFAEKPEIKYLLITYGAGGVGLNLQHSAQNVILLEPWYSTTSNRQGGMKRSRHRHGAE